MSDTRSLKNGATNEADVREEVAAPFLSALGYERGTSNDISRESRLEYGKQFLGRKKPTDPPLRGRADYVLTVIGSGSWVLEVKAPHEPIDIDAIEQAISYARHPEVAAYYAVVLNGSRLTVHRTWQASTEPPVADLPVSDPIDLARQLEGMLSPAAIRRDCGPPVVDLVEPLASGLRSRAKILTGEIRHTNSNWSSNTQLPSELAAPMDDLSRRLGGLIVTVIGGDIYRDEESRIRAKLRWSAPHDELLRFAIDKELMDAEYIALDHRISSDPDKPTVFDVVGDVEVKEGERLFNLAQWEIQRADLSLTMRYTGRAVGYISDYVFQGCFASRHICGFPSLPSLQFVINTIGTFHIELDRR